jgi:hypothetical protein
LKRNINQTDVEKLVMQGDLRDDRVGLFIMHIVGKHKMINSRNAKRYGLTYDDLVSDGSSFAFGYIRKFNIKRAHLSTYIYQLTSSFVKVMEKRYYKVKRRIPLNKISSIDVLMAATAVATPAMLNDYHTDIGSFVRMVVRDAVKQHVIEEERIDINIVCSMLDKLLIKFPDLKRVLQLYCEGYNVNEIKKKIGVEAYEKSKKEFVENKYEIRGMFS